jgi:hypothetical protein
VKAVCGHKVRISCTDSQYCTGKSVVVEVTNACPHSHPCNIASGHCVAGPDADHLDICDTAYYQLATNQPGGYGLKVSYSTVSHDTELGVSVSSNATSPTA